MSQSARCVLFTLQEPGYLRFFGSAINEMERRGWQIAVAFNNPDKRGAGVPVLRGAIRNVRWLGAVPGEAGARMALLRNAFDYLRYLEPVYANAVYLRRRVEKRLPRSLHSLTRLSGVSHWLFSAALAGERVAELATSANGDVRRFISNVSPDVVVVSPVVMIGPRGAHQTEIVKAGRELGIPVVVGVASWDHLTSKGMIHVVPDVVAVWNDVQAREAEFLHRIPRSRIVVTGAQPFDHWFEPAAPDAESAFRRMLNIDTDRHLILLVGSSRKMAPPDSEVEFARRWLAALRSAPVPEVRNAFVLVRPHPSNTKQWHNVDLGDRYAKVFPSGYSGMPLTAEEVETFRGSILASAAVVGVNTTAMIEAAILRRPVLSVRDAAFAHSQQQTLHFSYLSQDHGGCAVVSDSLDEHVGQLARALAGEHGLTAADRFVERFVRPDGLGIPATARFCDAIEHLARTPSSRHRSNSGMAASERSAAVAGESGLS